MAWTCPHCRTNIEQQFKACWKCGTDIDGQLDDHFSIELDPAELTDEPEIPRIRCTQCGYQGKVLFSTKSKTGLDWVIAGLVSIVVSQRSWIHFCHKVCPQCESSRESLRDWSGIASDEHEQSWIRASEAENRQAAKNRQLIYLALGSITLASWVLWLALR